MARKAGPPTKDCCIPKDVCEQMLWKKEKRKKTANGGSSEKEGKRSEWWAVLNGALCSNQQEALVVQTNGLCVCVCVCLSLGVCLCHCSSSLHFLICICNIVEKNQTDKSEGAENGGWRRGRKRKTQQMVDLARRPPPSPPLLPHTWCKKGCVEWVKTPEASLTYWGVTITTWPLKQAVATVGHCF